jgi:hypothetical protein
MDIAMVLAETGEDRVSLEQSKSPQSGQGQHDVRITLLVQVLHLFETTSFK